MGKRRAWKIFVGAWVSSFQDPPSFYSGFVTQGRAERRARKLIKRSLSTRKNIEMLSPVVVLGPKGVTLRLTMDMNKKLVEEAPQYAGEVLPSKTQLVIGTEEDPVVTKTKAKTKAKAKKIVPTHELRDRLKVKFPDPEWVFLNEVRDSVGFDRRSADCVAMSTWQSRGILLYGFELKVSRADVLKELRSPEKADAVGKYCDRWYLVLGSANLIKDSEVPETWGLIVPHGNGLRIRQEAKRAKPKKWDRGFVASMLRNAHQNPASADELRKEYLRGQKDGKANSTYEAHRAKEELESMRKRVNIFQEISGVTVLSDRYGYEGKVRSQAAKIRAIMTSGADSYYEDMSKLVLRMETLSRQVREKLVTKGALPEKPGLDDLCPHPNRHGRHELYILSLPKGARAKARSEGKPVPAHCRACGAEGEIE